MQTRRLLLRYFIASGSLLGIPQQVRRRISKLGQERLAHFIS